MNITAASGGFARVSASLDVLGFLCGISMHDIYLHPEAAVEAFTTGRNKLLERVDGRFDVSIPLTTPVIKYGHLNALGMELLFPPEGQVAPEHRNRTCRECRDLLLRSLERPWNESGMTPARIRYRETLMKAFPGERVHWGWQWEGPVTTAWALLGEEIFLQFYDDPDAVADLLRLCAESLVSYVDFYCTVDGTRTADPYPDHGRLCDDIAAMIPPPYWESHVLPAWDRFYAGRVPGKRLHCEDLKEIQLDFLNRSGITDFDSGISPALHPGILKKALRIPYAWRLGSFHYDGMTARDVMNFVFAAAEDRCRYVFTFLEPVMLSEETLDKVRLFAECGHEVDRCRESGTEEFADRVDRGWTWNDWTGFVV